jgi:hypothetical protein
MSSVISKVSEKPSREIFSVFSAVMIICRHYGLYLTSFLYWAAVTIIAASAIWTFSLLFKESNYTLWEAALILLLALDVMTTNILLVSAGCVCFVFEIIKAAKHGKYAVLVIMAVLVFSTVFRTATVIYSERQIDEIICCASSPDGKTEIYSREIVIGNDTYTDYFAVKSLGVIKRKVQLVSLYGKTESVEFVTESVVEIGGTQICITELAENNYLIPQLSSWGINI